MLTNLNKYQGTTTDEPKFRLYDLYRGVEMDEGKLYGDEEMMDFKDREFSALVNPDLQESFTKGTGTFVPDGGDVSVLLNDYGGSGVSRFVFMPDGDNNQNNFNRMLAMHAAGFHPDVVKYQIGAGNYRNAINSDFQLPKGLEGEVMILEALTEQLKNPEYVPDLDKKDREAQINMKQAGLTPRDAPQYIQSVVNSINEQGAGYEDLLSGKVLKGANSGNVSNLIDYYYETGPEGFNLSEQGRRTILTGEDKSRAVNFYDDLIQNEIQGLYDLIESLDLSDKNKKIIKDRVDAQAAINFQSPNPNIRVEAPTESGVGNIVLHNLIPQQFNYKNPKLTSSEDIKVQSDWENAINDALQIMKSQRAALDAGVQGALEITPENFFNLVVQNLPESAYEASNIEGAVGQIKPEYAQEMPNVQELLQTGTNMLMYDRGPINNIRQLRNDIVGNFVNFRNQQFKDYDEAYTENMGDVNVDYFRDFNVDENIPGGYTDPYTGKISYNLADLPKGVDGNPYLTTYYSNYRPREASGLLDYTKRFGENLFRGSPFAFSNQQDFKRDFPGLANTATGAYYIPATTLDFGSKMLAKGILATGIDPHTMVHNAFRGKTSEMSQGRREYLEDLAGGPILGLTFDRKPVWAGPSAAEANLYKGLNTGPGIYTDSPSSFMPTSPDDYTYSGASLNLEGTGDVGFDYFGNPIYKNKDGFVPGSRYGNPLFPLDLFAGEKTQEDIYNTFGMPGSLAFNIAGNYGMTRFPGAALRAGKNLATKGYRTTIDPSGAYQTSRIYSGLEPLKKIVGKGTNFSRIDDVASNTSMIEGTVGQGFFRPKQYFAGTGTTGIIPNTLGTGSKTFSLRKPTSQFNLSRGISGELSQGQLSNPKGTKGPAFGFGEFPMGRNVIVGGQEANAPLYFRSQFLNRNTLPSLFTQ